MDEDEAVDNYISLYPYGVYTCCNGVVKVGEPDADMPTLIQRMLDSDEFLEHVDFPWGQRVGTLWSEIARIRAEGKAPLLDLETDGALVVKRDIDDCVTIFVRAPSFEELERRLRARATESGGEIEKRLARAKQQLEQQDSFDYVIVNDDVGRAAAELLEIVRRELSGAGTMAS